VQNAQKEEFFRKVDDTTGFQTRSVLSVPLMMRDRATGVISALNKKNGQQFDDPDIVVLETLASQASIALENSRLLKESREAFANLAELDEMKSNFIAISSHELRIPLGLILGHATYLKEMVKGEEIDQVEVIERSAMRLKDIVEDLSQIENLQSDSASLRNNIFNLNEMMEKTISEHQSTADEKKIELVLKMPKKLISYEGEADKLRIGFNHILKNAIAFTDADGKVEVALNSDKDWIEITVSDTGIGVPKNELERIFDRFYQVEKHMTRKHGGMGLGLTIAKAMVEIHEGEIKMESVESKGSRVMVRLPRV
jgi:signal transduction histidine kinase